MNQIEEGVVGLMEDRRGLRLEQSDYLDIVHVFEAQFNDLTLEQQGKSVDGYWYYCSNAYRNFTPELEDVTAKIDLFAPFEDLPPTYAHTVGDIFKEYVRSAEGTQKVVIEPSQAFADSDDKQGLAITSVEIVQFLTDKLPQIKDKTFREYLGRMVVEVLGVRSVAYGIVEVLKSQGINKILPELEELVKTMSLSKRDEPYHDPGTRLVREKHILGGTRPSWQTGNESVVYTNVIRPIDKEFLQTLK